MTIRSTTSASGTMPSRMMPTPDRSTMTEPRIMAMTARPATNLPLMTSSRWMGCDTSRGSVPSDRSLLMASKPKAMPSTGPRNATRAANEGKVCPLMPGSPVTA